MKHIPSFTVAIAGLAVTFAANFTFASTPCEQALQFFGKVRNVQTGFSPARGPLCTYQLTIDTNRATATNPNCPLDVSDAQNLVFADESCTMVDGQNVSGTVVNSARPTIR